MSEVSGHPIQPDPETSQPGVAPDAAIAPDADPAAAWRLTLVGNALAAMGTTLINRAGRVEEP